MLHHPFEIIRRLFPVLLALVCLSWVVACVAPPYEPPGGESSDTQSGDTDDSSESDSDDGSNDDTEDDSEDIPRQQEPRPPAPAEVEIKKAA